MSRSPQEFTKAFDDRRREAAFKAVHGQTKDEWVADQQKRTACPLSTAKKAWRKLADEALAEDNRRRAEQECSAGIALKSMRVEPRSR